MLAALDDGVETPAVLSLAADSSRYEEVPGDDDHRVYRGPDTLLVETPDGGLYTEPLGAEPDGERYVDHEVDPADPLDRDPWRTVRTTTFTVTDGERAKVKEKIYRAIDRAGFLFDGRGREAETYVNRGDVGAEVRLYRDRIELREWGDVAVPDLAAVPELAVADVHLEDTGDA